MPKWKTLVGMSILSLSLMGCGANNGQNATTKSTSMTTNDTVTNQVYGTNASDISRKNFLANANVNDQYGNPQMYPSNSMYKDQTMGIRQTGSGTVSQAKFGYATYHKTDIHTQQASTYYVDRNVLARAIGTVVTSIPNVQNSSVLVTDEDIFVGVPGVKDVPTLNKVKLSAWSLSPRYYKVYVSSNGNTIDKVKALVAHTNNRNNIDETKLESILKNGAIDMTGTNVTDTGQNVTQYNLNQTFTNTNGTNKMK